MDYRIHRGESGFSEVSLVKTTGYNQQGQETKDGYGGG